MRSKIVKLTAFIMLLSMVMLGYDTNAYAEGYVKAFSEIRFADYDKVVAVHFGPNDDYRPDISEYAVFVNMLHLTSITVDEDNPYLASYDGCLYDKELTTLICFPQGLMGASIPKTCVAIWPNALAGKSISMRKQVKRIITQNNGGEWPGYERFRDDDVRKPSLPPKAK